MKFGVWVMTIAAVVCGGSLSRADTISYDASLASPGFYNGTGNPNGGFTISTNAGVEVGLRAKLRQSPNVIHSSDNVYVVPAGSQPGAPTRAAWNYEFSVNVHDAGLTLADITAMLTVTDITQGITATPIDALSYFGDDASYDGTAHQSVIVVSAYGAQNSENPAFANFPLPGYNMNALDKYSFTLDVKTTAGAHLATDSIEVDVVPTPLPSAMWGGMSLLACVGATTGVKRLRRPAIG